MQRQFRLKRDEDFARLRREGRAYRHPLMLMSVAANTVGHNRYGFITGKRLGGAVQRNRVRRLIREAVRLLHPGLRAGYDVVFIAHPPTVGQPFDVIQRTVNELFTQAKLVEMELQ
jgi:ribonuclease P protein component